MLHSKAEMASPAEKEKKRREQIKVDQITANLSKPLSLTAQWKSLAQNSSNMCFALGLPSGWGNKTATSRTPVHLGDAKPSLPPSLSSHPLPAAALTKLCRPPLVLGVSPTSDSSSPPRSFWLNRQNISEALFSIISHRESFPMAVYVLPKKTSSRERVQDWAWFNLLYLVTEAPSTQPTREHRPVCASLWCARGSTALKAGEADGRN